VLKRKVNLNQTRRSQLRDLLRYNLKKVRAYLLKEDFQQFWDYDSPAWAAKSLDDCCQQAMGSRIEPMKTSPRTHPQLLPRQKQFSSGVVEGLNNKVKLTMRKSCGFRTVHVTEIALYHALGKLPEPAPHSFC
jgi:transposase